MKSWSWLWLWVWVGALASGCATGATYQVQVNGYTEAAAPQPFAPGASFHIIDNQETKNPLLEKEIRTKLEVLLVKRGYPVTPYDRADYYLSFTYGLGTPQSVSVTTPSWGFGLGVGYGGPAAYGMYWPGYPPYNTQVQPLYDRWLQVKVVAGKQLRTTGKSHTVWVGEARSTGASSDLREVMNSLLIAAFEQFGQNTGKALRLDVNQDDPRFRELEKVR